jgi:hypothetical protein
LTQLDHAPQDQFSVQVQDWEIAGLFTLVPQLLASVQILVCWPATQVDQVPQDQFSMQQDWEVAGLESVV